MRFVELYAPLIFYWARQRGIERDLAADLVQDVLLTLVTKMRSFEYEAGRRFRGWLRTVTINRAIDFHRQSGLPTQELHSNSAIAPPVMSESDFFPTLNIASYSFVRRWIF